MFVKPINNWFFLVYFSLVLQAMSSAKYVEMCSKFASLIETKDAINEKCIDLLFHWNKKAKNEETQTLNSQAYANPNVINCI